ncbi:cytochrome bd-type quinol oxidase subunit 1 [Roseovarius sp. MBR-51]
MIAIGFAMLGLGVWALVRRVQGRLYDSPMLHRAALVMGPAGFVRRKLVGMEGVPE